MSLRYARMGGHEPQDDELLEIGDDGTFSLRRVVAIGAVGEFAGTLLAEGMADLERLAGEAAGAAAPEPGRQMPNQVWEHLSAGGEGWEFLREAELEGPLAELAAFARALTEELTDEPVAGLALTLNDDGTGGLLKAIGDQPATIDFSSATADYSLFGNEQEYMASGETSLDLPADAGELPSGWSTDVSLPTDLDFDPMKTLQVRFSFAMKYGDGIWRDAQITAVAGKGWF